MLEDFDIKLKIACKIMILYVARGSNKWSHGTIFSSCFAMNPLSILPEKTP